MPARCWNERETGEIGRIARSSTNRSRCIRLGRIGIPRSLLLFRTLPSSRVIPGGKWTAKSGTCHESFLVSPHLATLTPASSLGMLVPEENETRLSSRFVVSSLRERREQRDKFRSRGQLAAFNRKENRKLFENSVHASVMPLILPANSISRITSIFPAVLYRF